MNKLLYILVIIAILSVIIACGTFSVVTLNSYFLKPTPTLTPTITTVPTLTPTSINTPTLIPTKKSVIKQTPSIRALEAAAGFLVNLSPSDKDKVLKANYWSSLSEAIDATAKVLDNDPTKLVQIEVALKNFNANKNSGTSNNCVTQKIGDMFFTNCN